MSQKQNKEQSNKEEMEQPKKKPIIIRKIDIDKTLAAIPQGYDILIKRAEAKPNTIRKAAERLSPMKFDISEKGLSNETKVTRIQ